MMRTLLVALSAYAGAAAGAENLDAAPIGTVVSGSFELGGRSIPLPEGEYALAARSVNEPAMLEGSASIPRASVVQALLVQAQPPRLRAAVYARVALKPPNYRFTWSMQPCRKEDVLHRADLVQGNGGGSENCLLVDHVLGNFGPRSQGVWKDAAGWLAERGVELPVPLLIVANVTRIEGWQLVSASYAFNPRMFGCNAPRARSWAASPWHRKTVAEDPQRVRFVESVTAWGELAQRHFDALVRGHAPVVEKPPAIHSCAAAQAALELRRAP